MPFLPEKYKRNYQSHFCRKAIHFRTLHPHQITNDHVENPLIKPVKRVSWFPLLWAGSCPGSMSVEASLAVPLFLFFFINILSLILFFHTYAANLEELHQQGRQLAMLAYATGENIGTQDELIRLVKPVRMKAPVPILAYPGTMITSCCYMRAWTGYDVTRGGDAGEGEIYVYITEHGTVYHRTESCSHLRLSIELVAKSEVGQLRNSSGGKYYACEKCGDRDAGAVYITGEGNRYHNTINCSGLRRSVRCVPLSEAGGLPPCGRCG